MKGVKHVLMYFNDFERKAIIRKHLSARNIWSACVQLISNASYATHVTSICAFREAITLKLLCEIKPDSYHKFYLIYIKPYSITLDANIIVKQCVV